VYDTGIVRSLCGFWKDDQGDAKVKYLLTFVIHKGIQRTAP